MLKCKFCGSEMQEGTKFCSTCGAKVDEPAAVDGMVRSAPPVNNKQETPKANKPFKRPLQGGMLAWSIANIASALGSCCCFAPFVSLVLGIIALIYTLLASDCVTDNIAKNRIHTARILNIVATCITIISVIAYIAIIVFGFIASGGLDELLPYPYYYFD